MPMRKVVTPKSRVQVIDILYIIVCILLYVCIYIEWASARVPPTPPIWGVLQREGER